MNDDEMRAEIIGRYENGIGRYQRADSPARQKIRDTVNKMTSAQLRAVLLPVQPEPDFDAEPQPVRYVSAYYKPDGGEWVNSSWYH